MDIAMSGMITLGFICVILLYIFAMCFKAIKEEMLWRFFRKDYIRVIIVYKDRIMSDKPMKVKGQVDFKDGDRTYTIDHSCVYLTNGKTPTLIYEADDPQPKNVLSETVEQVLSCPTCKSEMLMTFKKPIFPSGEELDNMMMRAKSAGLIKGLMKELPMLIKLLWISILIGGAICIGLYALWNQLPEKIITLLLPKLKEATVGALIP